MQLVTSIAEAWTEARDSYVNVVDPVGRLMDEDFSERLWYYEHSRIGDEVPGNLHPKQVAALINRARHRWLFWGNQVGKTTLGAVDIVLKALGRHPLQLAGITRMPPRTSWASALTWELWENILLPELLTWIPYDRIVSAPEPNKHSTRRDIVIKADNGKLSRITGKAAEQGARKYQSARVDDIWLDEEHPEAVWDEMQPRLVRYGGHTLATMTPLLGFTWVHSRVYEPSTLGQIPADRHWFSHAGLNDNPAIDPMEIEELTQELQHNPTQLAARLEGKFTRPHGAVLPWDKDKHSVVVTNDTRLEWKKRGVTWFAAIDLGKWRFGMIFGPVDHESVFTLLDEYFSQNEGAALRAKAMHHLWKRWDVPDSIVIVADCADPGGIDTLNGELERIESPYRIASIDAAYKSKTTGISRVENMLNRGALKVREGIGKTHTWKLGMNAQKPGKPMMGSRWIWEASNWQYPKTDDGKVQKDEPNDATADGADLMDCTRYLAMEIYGPELPKEKPKAPSLTERIRRELQGLDEPVGPKKFYGVMRQG